MKHFIGIIAILVSITNIMNHGLFDTSGGAEALGINAVYVVFYLGSIWYLVSLFNSKKTSEEDKDSNLKNR